MKLEAKILIIALLSLLTAPVIVNHRSKAATRLDIQTKQAQAAQAPVVVADAPKPAEQPKEAVKPPEQAPAPVVVAPPAPKPVPVAGNCESYRAMVAQYDWNVNVALAVMNAESGCRANNDNPTDHHPTCLGSRGLFQIGCDSTSNYAGMFDPAANIAQAYNLYARRGWQPWSSTTCKYKVACG